MSNSVLRGWLAITALLCGTLTALADGAIGPTMLLGGSGGTEFSSQCNAGDYLVGIYADFNNDINSVIPLCQTFDGDRPRDNAYPLGKSGQDATDANGLVSEYEVICPAGTVIEAISVTSSYAALVHKYNLLCRNPSDNKYAVTDWLGPGKGAGASSDKVGCGGGALAVGLIGRSGALVDALGLLCQEQAQADELPAPSRVTTTTVMLESMNFPGMFIRRQNGKVLLTKLSSDLDLRDATFVMQPALTGQGKTVVSFESADYPGYFLRHRTFALVLEKNDRSQQFAEDSSFIRLKPSDSKGNQFESVNFPGLVIRHRNFELVLDYQDGSAQSKADALFVVEAPLTMPAVDDGDGATAPQNIDIGIRDDKSGGATAATDTTIYDRPAGNDVDYLSAGDALTIVRCNNDNWCQISGPENGWV